MAGKRIIMSGLPFQEIGNERETEKLALFRMELCANHVVATDRCSDIAAIIGHRENFSLVLRVEHIRMNEIGVQAILAGLNTVEDRVGMFHVNPVPADLRNLERRIGW